MKPLKTTIIYTTEDDFHFKSKDKALIHRRLLNMAAKASRLFRGGYSLGAALRGAGYKGMLAPGLFRMTRKGSFESRTHGDCTVYDIGLPQSTLLRHGHESENDRYPRDGFRLDPETNGDNIPKAWQYLAIWYEWSEGHEFCDQSFMSIGSANKRIKP